MKIETVYHYANPDHSVMDKDGRRNTAGCGMQLPTYAQAAFFTPGVLTEHAAYIATLQAVQVPAAAKVSICAACLAVDSASENADPRKVMAA